MTTHNKNKVIAMSLITCLGLATGAQAGMISTSTPASPAKSTGFGGWNLSNVTPKVTNLEYETIEGSSFSKTDGSYSRSGLNGNMTYGDSFESDIHDSIDASGAVLVHLHGKDWPVGEPAGIKIIHNATPMSRDRPGSCVMTTSFLADHYLDSSNPIEETDCDADFQTHKRFKLNMLPTMVTAVDSDGYGKGVNLTFNVDAADLVSGSGSTKYTLLHKINNYTGKKLDGYKIELGFVGADGNFTKVSDAAGTPDIKLSIGINENTSGKPTADIWEDTKLASFSHGLFGAPDNHFTENGFFDSRSTGFYVDLNTTTADTIKSTTAIESNYGTLFGDWLPNIWAPQGIFWDSDNDPETDADLVAYWNGSAWLQGNEHSFAPATSEQLLNWASNPTYGIDVVEDVLNLGVTYILEIGDITTFPTYNTTKTFTLRITPKVAATQTAPAYVATTPAPLSDFLVEAGSVAITPSSAFIIGSPFEIVVADKDLNTSDTVDVNISITSGTVVAVASDSSSVVSKVVTLPKKRAGLFAISLPTALGAPAIADDGSLTLQADSVVSVSYADAFDGNAAATVTASSTVTTATDTTDSSSGSSSSTFSTMNNTSLFAMIFGFLAIGTLIARRKLSN